MQGLRAGWRRPTTGMLTYGGEVVAAHRLGGGARARRRSGTTRLRSTSILWARRLGTRSSGRGSPPGGGRGHDVAAVSGLRGGGAELSGRRCGALGRGGAELGTTAARRIDGAEVAKCWKRGRGEEIYGGDLLSRVEPRPGTKEPFVPGGGFTRDKRPPLLSRVVDPTGTKGIFGWAGKIPSPRPTFSPG